MRGKEIVKVATYQLTPAKDVDIRKGQLCAILKKTHDDQIDFLCLPEGFLTGYYSEEKEARENSLEVGSKIFEEWLALFKNSSTTVIVGFNERDHQAIFDSAAVIEQGQLLGIQRKHHLYYKYFTAGDSFSVFQSKGIPFGVAICLDTQYFEPCRLLALQGAVIIFSPMCNKVPSNHSYAKRPSYYSHFVARSFENRCWLLTADWVWSYDGHALCPGHSVIYDPQGMEIMRSQEMQEELVVMDIPHHQLCFDKGLRVKGSAVLVQQLTKLKEAMHT